MFYNTSDSKLTKLFKQLIFWFSLVAMLGLVLFLFSNETKIAPHAMSIEIDIKNKVNICEPKNSKELNSKKPYEL